jgi:hypothetical protein
LDDRFAWTALDLGMRISIGSRRKGVRSAYGYNPMDDSHSHEQSVSEALNIYFNRSEYPELTPPPPAWVFESPKHDGFDDEQCSNKPTWCSPDEIWRWDYAPKVLAQAPIDKIMLDPARQKQFLHLCHSLLSWTIDKINPPWEENESNRVDRRETELLEWRQKFSHLFANVAGYLDANTVQSEFLDTIFTQEDKICISFLAPLVSIFICRHVLDAETVRQDVLEVLDSCLDRILEDQTFKRTGYRDGILHGFDLPYLVRDLLFISVENVEGAKRYANGCWNEINIVMPLVDKFVRAAGWMSSVASAFLTLCERCGPSYPAEIFADQILSFVESNNMPRWQGTDIPARIAGLIQTYSDREYPLKQDLSQKMLRILDALVDLGDRRSAALQVSDAFRDVRIETQEGSHLHS